MCTFASEVSNHQAKIISQLLLNVEIVGLHICILVIPLNGTRRDSAASLVECIRKAQARTGGRETDRKGEGRIRRQSSHDSGNGLVVHNRVSAANQSLPILEYVP